MIRKLSNGALLSWDYEPDLMLLTAMITDVVEGLPNIIIADAYILEPSPDQQIPDLIRDSLNTFESEYLRDYQEFGASLDYLEQVEDDFVSQSTVCCDLCSHYWEAEFYEDTCKLECPNCENLVNYEIV